MSLINALSTCDQEYKARSSYDQFHNMVQGITINSIIWSRVTSSLGTM